MSPTSPQLHHGHRLRAVPFLLGGRPDRSFSFGRSLTPVARKKPLHPYSRAFVGSAPAPLTTSPSNLPRGLFDGSESCLLPENPRLTAGSSGPVTLPTWLSPRAALAIGCAGFVSSPTVGRRLGLRSSSTLSDSIAKSGGCCATMSYRPTERWGSRSRRRWLCSAEDIGSRRMRANKEAIR